MEELEEELELGGTDVAENIPIADILEKRVSVMPDFDDILQEAAAEEPIQPPKTMDAMQDYLIEMQDKFNKI